LQYFCRALGYLLHQRTLVFWKRLFFSNNAVIISLSRHVYNSFVAVGSIYGVVSITTPVNVIKGRIWHFLLHVVDSNAFLMIFAFIVLVCIWYCVCAAYGV